MGLCQVCRVEEEPDMAAFPNNFLISGLVALMLSQPALASGGGGHGSSGGSKTPSNQFEAKWSLEKDADKDAQVDVKEVGQAVDIPFVVLPVTIKGRFRTYAFISVRLHLHDNVDVWSIRSKTHFMKDAIVRIGSKDGVAYDEQQNELDKTQLEKMVRASIQPWLPESDLDKIQFLKLDIQG